MRNPMVFAVSCFVVACSSQGLDGKPGSSEGSSGSPASTPGTFHIAECSTHPDSEALSRICVFDSTGKT